MREIRLNQIKADFPNQESFGIIDAEIGMIQAKVQLGGSDNIAYLFIVK